MKQLSGHDMAMLMQDGPRTPNQMGPVLICDQASAPGGRVTFKEILAEIESRLHLVPPLRQRLLQVPLGLDNPYWVDDQDFDLEFHVRHIALPKPGDWRQLCIQAARLFSRPIDLARPPWELYVIEGLDHVEDVSPGSFAVLMKIHHSLIDGKEGAQLMTLLTGVEQFATVEPPTRAWRPAPAPSALSLLARSATHLHRRPLGALRLAQVTLPELPALGPLIARRLTKGAQTPVTRFNHRVSAHRVIDAVQLDLGEARRIRKAIPERVTVNDIALCVVAGALRRYLESKDELPELPLVAAVPISTRIEGQEGQGGNQIEGARVTIRTDIDDDLDRLLAIAATTKEIRTVQRGVGVKHMAHMSEVVPGNLLGAGLRFGAEMMARTGIATPANVVVTNVPGPPIPLWFLGTRIEQAIGAGPVLDGMGLIHLVSSYVGDMTISITACREMLPDPAFYCDCLRDSFTALAKAV